MQRMWRDLAACAVLGVVFGAVVGVAGVWAERHLAHGFHLLALRTLAGAVLRYGAVALVGGLLGSGLRVALRTLAARLGPAAGGAVELSAWLTMALPVWLALPLLDRWLVPFGARGAIAAAGVLAVLHAALWALLVRRGRPGAPPRAAGALAGAGAAVLAVAAYVVVPALRAGPERPNVLLLVMDTTRADRLSCYGYPRPTSPELDAFAREAIRFDAFYSTSSWTIPSHASLFTGLYPVRHGATQEKMHLERSFATLAEAFAEAGYATLGVSANPYVGEGTRLAQGFERFEETWRGRLTVMGHAAEARHPVNVALERLLAEVDDDRPFFAFANYMDPHLPYHPPQPYLGRFTRGREIESIRTLADGEWAPTFLKGRLTQDELAALSDLYDAEVAYLSHALGRLLDGLRVDGRFEDTLIVITSDHGEHFGENDLFGHMFGIYNTAVRVPLLVRLPGGERGGRVDAHPGQLVDLFPTLLGAAGIDSPVEAHGEDLLAPGRARQTVYSEYYYPEQVLALFTREERAAHAERLARYRHRLRAIQEDGLRFIWSSRGRHELYDLVNDPGETRNLYDPERPSPAAERLRARVESYVERFGGDELPPEPEGDAAGPDDALDAQTHEALRNLGYLR